MASGRGFFTGLLIGGLLGAGVAILAATKTGERVREQFLESGGEWGTRVEDAGALARAAAETLVEVSKDVVEQQKQRFQEAVRESREAADETTAEMLAEYDRARRGGSSA